MMNEDELRVVFIGGLTNGKIVMDYLAKNRYVEVPLAITYAGNAQGARQATIIGASKTYKTGECKSHEEEIRRVNPDLIVVAGWSELIPQSIVEIPRMGTIGFHPAKLPKDRGRSVLAWQIEEGYTETALTMFKYTDYPDGGDIIGQETIRIAENDYINDVLDKVDAATLNLMRAYFPLIRQGLAKPRKQDLSEGNSRRLRGAADSVINWNSNSRDIYNKVRAISYPYPGATTVLDNQGINVWRSEIVDDFPYGQQEQPGTVIARLFDGSLIFKTRDCFLRVTEYTGICPAK